MNKIFLWRFFIVCLFVIIMGADLHTATAIPAMPTATIGLTVTKVAAGGYHTCALYRNGTVKCWGKNTFGQIGDGGTTSRKTPTSVSGLAATAVDIAGGQNHTCAVLSTGAVQCWGYNDDGQLGTGGTTDSSVPKTVSGLSGTATAVTAGDAHTCALLSTGAVQCWGLNSTGQLGNGTTADSTTPVSVSLSNMAVAIDVGGYHTCALLSTGSLWCWGNNAWGQLGIGTTTSSSNPQMVADLSTTVMHFSAGGYHTCAGTNTGNVECWGNNDSGELGNDDTTMDFASPYKVIHYSGTDSWSGASMAEASGQGYTCAMSDSGVVDCWGNNYSGELGNNSNTDSTYPVTVSGFSNADVITAGDHHNCALLRTGTVKCWGMNNYGQLGDGTATKSNTAVSVTGL